jgi:hypothetical protein
MDGIQLISRIIDFILTNSVQNDSKIDAVEAKTLDLCIHAVTALLQADR